MTHDADAKGKEPDSKGHTLHASAIGCPVHIRTENSLRLPGAEEEAGWAFVTYMY